ncbi:Protein LMBR1L [Dirofilaria immitis]|nr:Protein LMBR1L [Dirofilaria immitis]
MEQWEDVSEREQRFHQFIRQHIERSDNDELYAGGEDFFVFRVSLWMCTWSLAVSMGAATLLPFSVIGSEIIQAYPGNYYFQWLNWPLIHSLWNYIFALSNLSLFILLPFAYFFIESQGFKGHGKGIMTRVYETVAVCILLIIVLICLADVIYSLFLTESASISLSILSFTSVNLPFLYSCVSLLGVLTLLITTPIGLARMFSVVSNHLLATEHHKITDPLEEAVFRLEYQTLKRRLRRNKQGDVLLPDPFLPRKPLRGYQVVLQTVKYVSAIVILLLLTTITVLMVLINTLQLLFGFRALPVYAQYMEVNSRHTLGILVLYIMIAAMIGVYSVPFLRRIQPQLHKTSMTCVIANCTTVLILSSALPVLARTLGITTFDLVGAYGSFMWLSNFTLVWTYNVAFAFVTISCLLNHFTTPVRRKLSKSVKICYLLSSTGDQLFINEINRIRELSYRIKATGNVEKMD